MTEYDKILEKSVMTEEEFLKCLNKGIINTECLGKEVIIPNKLSTPEVSPKAYNESYIISDISHDGVYGAVDVISKDVINKGEPFKIQNQGEQIKSTTGYYVDSYIDKWLNEDFLDGFSDNIKNALVDMKVESNGSIVDRKVKLLSEAEIGKFLADILIEGSAYPIFTDNKSRIKYETWKNTDQAPYVVYTYSTPARYWTRSRAMSIHGHELTVSPDGEANIVYWCSNNLGIVPVLRFMNNMELFPNDYLRKRQLTESECISYAGITGFTKDFIGKEIVITNNGREELYEIAGIDHDRHAGSIDLISKQYIMGGEKIKFGGIPLSYSTSNLRNFLNSDYYNGFGDDLKNVMQRMLCVNTLDAEHPLADMVKALSTTELGLETKYNTYDDGTKYDLFDPEDKYTFMREVDGIYFLRTIDTAAIYNDLCFGAGYINGNVLDPGVLTLPYYKDYSMVAAIRIKNNTSCDEILSRDWLYDYEFTYCLERNAITKDHIGKLVDVWSSVCDDRTYMIADVEHDGIANTVDLIAYTPVNKFKKFDSNENNNDYTQSEIRMYLNNEYYEGLSNTIKSRMATFEIQTTTVDEETGKARVENDHIKLLTCTEVGFEEFSLLDITKGSVYPIFTDNNSRIKYTNWNGKILPREYWLMTAYNQEECAMAVSEFGGYGAYHPTNSFGIVPVLRFYQGEIPTESTETSNTDESTE